MVSPRPSSRREAHEGRLHVGQQLQQVGAEQLALRHERNHVEPDGPEEATASRAFGSVAPGVSTASNLFTRRRCRRSCGGENRAVLFSKVTVTGPARGRKES
jgi:hypothetical protein